MLSFRNVNVDEKCVISDACFAINIMDNSTGQDADAGVDGDQADLLLHDRMAPILNNGISFPNRTISAKAYIQSAFA